MTCTANKRPSYMRSASGHAAAPPMSVINWRRPMKAVICPSSQKGYTLNNSTLPEHKRGAKPGAHASGGFPSPPRWPM